MAYIDTLIDRGERHFDRRKGLMRFWQDCAEQFYPERSDFLGGSVHDGRFARDLYSSYPIIVRRELGNAFSGILRPTNTEWFQMAPSDAEVKGQAGRQFLEWAAKRQRRAMYDRRASFVRATKQGDHDFACFGQAVISYEIDWTKPALLYRNWHLKDVAWADGYDGSIGEVHHNWKISIRDLKKRFGADNLHPSVRDSQDDGREIPCRVVVIPSDEYEGKKMNQPWARCLLDIENRHLIGCVGWWVMGYAIPRWQTVSGSPYAYSPAVVAGLPDARLIQAITLTLLEAGELAVRPPLIATKDAIRGDMNYYAGGITVADADYDERLGDVLRPIAQDKSGLPFGFEMQQDIRGMLASAFYLNKLTLPQTGSKEMTAYETSERIQEYIREATPLFEPMEHEYNGVLCEGTFELLLRAGIFGAPQDIPEELRGRDIHFNFISPLHDAIERKHANQFVETKSLLLHAMEIDPTAKTHIDITEAFRDAVKGVGAPATWLKDQDEANREAAAMLQQQQDERDVQQVAMEGQAAEAAAAGTQALANVA